ncbi:hypothetical protein DASC09_043340 [Saccharomycopsis crataegensis]|uniref:Integrase catalytic domain-containing protein n=1 Tax=Saccharomycopsis crataegensis TaxID=43959 RepID=A0AAV5QQM1_9ASCO|nr:hypothetical protein DASC09_043340 [Saccharomycopsis crataegensis]
MVKESKGEATAALQEILKDGYTQVVTDNGKEFKSHDMKAFCIKTSIIHRRPPAYSSDLNSFIERYNLVIKQTSIKKRYIVYANPQGFSTAISKISSPMN